METTKVYLDFETRSLCDLKAAGAYAYAKDPSTEVICLGIRHLGNEIIWFPGMELPKVLSGDHIFIAHNYLFDFQIWNFCATKKYGFPFTPQSRWDCTAARGLSYAMPKSLEMLAVALGLPVKKDMTGKRLIMKVSRPRKPTIHNKELWHDLESCRDQIASYCLKDVEVLEAIDKALPPLQKQERPVLDLDYKINSFGIPIDIDLATKAKEFVEKYNKEQLKRFREITGLDSPRQVAKLNEWLKKKGLKINKLDKAAVAGMLVDSTGEIREALFIRQNLAKSSTAKLESILQKNYKDRVYGGLIYHAATTGRWGGSGIQIQNFPRPAIENPEECTEEILKGNYDSFKSKYPKVQAAVSSILRHVVCAPGGKEFIISDFAAIEARLVFFLSRCQKGITQFKQDRDLYKEMASVLYKIPVDKIDKTQRFLGKSLILGAGYGLGAKKFKASCAAQGVEISEELADKAIRTYRDTYKEIKNFWYAVSGAAIAAVNQGTVQEVNGLYFAKKGNFLFIQLLSGRKLSYYSPLVIQGEKGPQLTYMGVNSVSKKWERQRTYGGRLVENITQATARDLLVNSMFNLDKNKIDISFTVHDEIVAEVPCGSVSIEHFDSLMTDLPTWAKGFPIKVETHIAKRYSK